MGKLVYFVESPRHSVIRFVKNYRTAGFLRCERIEYSLFASDSKPFADDGTTDLVCKRIKKDHPQAKVYCTTYTEFEEMYSTHLFWIICRWNKKSKIDGFYSHSEHKKVFWTKDIGDAEISLDKKGATDSLDNIRRLSGERVNVIPIYLDLINELLTPVFMLTCTSKSGGATKYFASLEDKKIRLVNMSDKAKKFTYEQAIKAFEYLSEHHKQYLYAVLPVFSSNVKSTDIEQYITDHHVSPLS